MIGVFEGMVRQNPQRTCFTFVDKEGNVEAFSYREARMMAAAWPACCAEEASSRRCRGGRPAEQPGVRHHAACGRLRRVLAHHHEHAPDRCREAGAPARPAALPRRERRLYRRRVERGAPAPNRGGRGHRHRPMRLRTVAGHAQRTAFAARTNIATAEARTTRALGRAGPRAARRRAVARTLPVKMRWKASSISPNAARMCSIRAPWRWSCSRPAPPAVRRPCP